MEREILSGHYDKPIHTVERYGEAGMTNPKIYDIHDLCKGMIVKVVYGSNTYAGEVMSVCTISETFGLESMAFEHESIVYFKDEEDVENMEFDFYDCEVTCFS